MKVYFDTCALNRLTDDQSQERIRDEAEAVTRILDLIANNDLEWVVSDLLRMELGQNPNLASREISLAYLELASELSRLNQIPTSVPSLWSATDSVGLMLCILPLLSRPALHGSLLWTTGLSVAPRNAEKIYKLKSSIR